MKNEINAIYFLGRPRPAVALVFPGVAFFPLPPAGSSALRLLALGVMVKKPSRRPCVAVFKFFSNLSHPLRTRSSLNPLSLTKNSTKPSTSGDSHLI